MKTTLLLIGNEVNTLPPNKQRKSTLNRTIRALLHNGNTHRLGGIDNLRHNTLERDALQIGVLLLHLGNLVDLLEGHLSHVHVTRLGTNRHFQRPIPTCTSQLRRSA